MATVRLLQPTSFLGIQNFVPTTSASHSSTELIFNTTGGQYFLAALGTFDDFPTGIITEVVVDTRDEGVYPNLQITGLSYYVAGSTFDNLANYGGLLSFLESLLSGSDTVIGSSGADGLAGFDGDDTLIGGAGGDALFGNLGNNTASYRTAAAGVFAGLEDTAYNSGDALGDAYFNISNLEGSAFDDILYGTDFVNRLSGGTGNDLLVGKGGGDALVGGTDVDTVSYHTSGAVRADLLTPATNTGDAKGDTYSSIENLAGSYADDILLGDNSANAVRGNAYPDLTSGNDKLYGRGGNDTLEGDDGNDLLDGGTGVDTMKGGTGNDVLLGGAGNDVLDGGIGTDWAYYNDKTTAVSVTLAGAANAIVKVNGVAEDTIRNIENVLGGSGNDVLVGDGLANALFGLAGNDILNGKAGKDVLAGGLGNDHFVFDTAPNASTNIDTVTDFNVANDTIRLENAIFTAILGTGTLTAGQFVANASGTAQDSADRIVYETDTGKLFYDSNGNAAGGPVQFGLLTSGLALTNADFFII